MSGFDHTVFAAKGVINNASYPQEAPGWEISMIYSILQALYLCGTGNCERQCVNRPPSPTEFNTLQLPFYLRSLSSLSIHVLLKKQLNLNGISFLLISTYGRLLFSSVDNGSLPINSRFHSVGIALCKLI